MSRGSKPPVVPHRYYAHHTGIYIMQVIAERICRRFADERPGDSPKSKKPMRFKFYGMRVAIIEHEGCKRLHECVGDEIGQGMAPAVFARKGITKEAMRAIIEFEAPRVLEACDFEVLWYEYDAKFRNDL